MNLTSQQQGNFSIKAGKLWQLLGVAFMTWQTVVPVALLVTSSTLLTAKVSYAEDTSTVKIVQGFGYDPAGGYKMLIQSRSGNQYYVWYENLIGAKVGSVITLTSEGSGSSLYMYKLINPGNGKEARVFRYLRTN